MLILTMLLITVKTTDLSTRDLLQLRDLSAISQEGRRQQLVEAASNISPQGTWQLENWINYWGKGGEGKTVS